MKNSIYLHRFFLFLFPLTLCATTDSEKIKTIKYQSLLKKNFLAKETALITKDSLCELDVLPKEESKRTLCGFFDLTYTLCGKIFLEKIITEPITDIQLLKNRQKIIKKYKDNPELCEKIGAELATIATHEHAFLAYFDAEHADHAKINSFYFSENYSKYDLNNSATALEFKYATSSISSLAWMSGLSYIPLFLYAANTYRLEEAEKKEADKNNSISWSTIFINSLAGPLRGYNPYISISKNKFALTGGDQAFLLMQEQKIPLWLAYGIIFGKQISAAGSTYKTARSITGFLQKKQNDTKKLCSSLESLSRIQESHNRIQELLGLEHTNSLLPTHEQKKIGALLILHKKIQESKTMLLTMARELGELDAYLAIAKSIREIEAADKPCCFVRFIDSSKAELTLDSFWNPLVHTAPDHTIISNSLSLGGESSTRSWIITGPHGCGKSTLMRSVAINILLAQSMGIAFAQSARLSCFDSINTYLSISEDRDKGWSTFMAEQEAAEKILEKIKKAQKSFTVFDELFKGTLEKEAGKRIVELGLKIAALPDALCMLATHAQAPIELETKTNQICKNYHGEIIDTHDGLFSHSYIFLPGENRWWFADDAKRSRFIEYLALSRNK